MSVAPDEIIIIKGQDKTNAVQQLCEMPDGRIAVSFKNSPRTYRYAAHHVTRLDKPERFYPIRDNMKIFVNRRRRNDIDQALRFTLGSAVYWILVTVSYKRIHLSGDQVHLRHNCLSDHRASGVFNYLKECAFANKFGQISEDSPGLLAAKYTSRDFIDTETVAANYLDPAKKLKHRCSRQPIFPFGSNESQMDAVERALTNQLSVIQGPPGTGKTQTILNIAANLLLQGKNALIVSSNNSAVENIQHKLTEHGFDFVMAPLGNLENKKRFIDSQPNVSPDITEWAIDAEAFRDKQRAIDEAIPVIRQVHSLNRKIASYHREIEQLELESKHFNQELSLQFQPYSGLRVKSHWILWLIDAIEEESTNKRAVRITRLARKLKKKFLLRFIVKPSTPNDSAHTETLIDELRHHFYHLRLGELRCRLNELNKKKQQLENNWTPTDLSNESMTLFKAALAEKYKKRERTQFSSIHALNRQWEDVVNEYPVVLSTTFSSSDTLSADTIFDYVIMDEASQVSVETGFLALTCARNAVIVGDSKQLPNVVDDDTAMELEEIQQRHKIDDAYSCTNLGFLGSVLGVFPSVTQTLLREHYRCVPDIIDFCNQRYYDGQLLIMSSSSEPGESLTAILTAPGKHSRNNYNQREIDTIKTDFLANRKDRHSEIGIIAPYNNQVNELASQLPDIESATIHKFQGREKDVMIMSVTNDTVTPFVDNPNLINVAVSRARRHFCIVTSGNPQQCGTNIADLIDYIAYRNGTVTNGSLHSIFDYLHTNYQDKLAKLSRISSFDSENLTYELICNILTEEKELGHLRALCHYPLRTLISDLSILTDDERKYAAHPATHLDFLIFNPVTKRAVLAVETDGYTYHNENTEQFERDRKKDRILNTLGLPLLRLSTTGHSEHELLTQALFAALHQTKQS